MLVGQRADQQAQRLVRRHRAAGCTLMSPPANPWDEFARAYAQILAERELPGMDNVGMLAQLVDLLGELDGRTALDAGCGEGQLAWILAERGAQVTGIDLSPRLIDMACAQDPAGRIDYRVGDLSRLDPTRSERFDRIGSYFVLNDVYDHRGFAATLAVLAAPGARIVLAFNSPYAAVAKGQIADYFDADAIGTYVGMWKHGVKARYYHRTLEGYLDAFMAAGLTLVKLVDVIDTFGLEWMPSEGARFPRFMILAFEKR
jgi:2-polyprenyl-3-methyl-5-hydroxy-6-metoxy-1,4-benzoquinol methylase